MRTHTHTHTITHTHTHTLSLSLLLAHTPEQRGRINSEALSHKLLGPAILLQGLMALNEIVPELEALEERQRIARHAHRHVSLGK
jgi:hypothetical protein